MVYRRHGLWWIRWRADGKEHRQSVARRLGVAAKLVTRQHADLALKQAHAEVLGALEPIRTGRMPLAQSLDALAATMPEETRTEARPLLEHLKTRVGDWLLRDVTEERLQEWVAQAMADGMAPATAKKRIGYVGAALRLAVRRGWLAKAPALPAIEVDNARQGFVTADELAAILGQLRPRAMPEADAVEWAYLTAWRQGEVIALQWADVDLVALQVTVQESKNGDKRVLPLVGAIRDVIERRLLSKNGPMVFHRHGKALGPKRLLVTFQKGAAAAGCAPGLVFHDLRRSAVRNMELAGVPRAVAMKVSGHRTETIYRRYAITSTEDVAEALRKAQGAA
jgi:integrase